MTNCERCGRPRKLNAFGLCDDCQIELAGEPNPQDSTEWARVRSALAQDAPCPDCHGGGQVGRMTQDGTTMYLVTCDKCGGSGRVSQEDAPRDHSMDSYRERLTAQYAEHAQPAVDRADPAQSNLAAYAEFMRGHAEESEKRALAAEERADAAAWAAGELRAALEGLLESGCMDYVNPRNDDTSCAVCGAVSRHPFRHRAGCVVQKAEDALGDTEDVGKWAEQYRALVKTAHTIMFEAVPFSDQGGGFTITEDEWNALRLAVAAAQGIDRATLEGTEDEARSGYDYNAANLPDAGGME